MNVICDPMFEIAIPIRIPSAPTSYSVPTSSATICWENSASPSCTKCTVPPALNLSVNERA